MTGKPVFVCIGTQRSGTSWLYRQFQLIEGISLPYIKEYHFFDRSPYYPSTNNLYGKNIFERLKKKWWFKNNIRYTFGALRNSENLRILFWRLKFYWHLGEYDDRWYLKTFRNLKGVTGEFTPEYALLNEEDIAKMANLLPDVKIIYILRDPIERTWSHIRYNASKNGKNKDIDVRKVISRFEDKRYFHDHVNYLENIKRYAKHFPKENILITFFDSIANEPQEMLDSLLREIAPGLKHQIGPDKKVNASREEEIPKEIYNYLKERYASLYKDLKDELGGYAVQWYNRHYDELKINKKLPKPILLKASNIL